MVTGDETAGARHVLDDDRGLAGYVLAQVAAEQAGVRVEAAARGQPHHDLDGLAVVERGPLSPGRVGDDEPDQAREQREKPDEAD